MSSGPASVGYSFSVSPSSRSVDSLIEGMKAKVPSFAILLSAGSASAPVCKALSSKRSNGSCPIHTTVGLCGMSSGW